MLDTQILYDTQSTQYAMYLNGQFIGLKATYLDADNELKRLAEMAQPRQSYASLDASHPPVSSEAPIATTPPVISPENSADAATGITQPLPAIDASTPKGLFVPKELIDQWKAAEKKLAQAQPMLDVQRVILLDMNMNTIQVFDHAHDVVILAKHVLTTREPIVHSETIWQPLTLFYSFATRALHVVCNNTKDLQ